MRTGLLVTVLLTALDFASAGCDAKVDACIFDEPSLLQGALKGGHASEDHHSAATVAAAAPQERMCNGRSDLCSLRFNETTLLGSHNAGSHHLGRTTGCKSVNHNTNEIQQLDNGVRSFDLDTCEWWGTMWNCHHTLTTYWGEELATSLTNVRRWLDENPNEVMMISFGDHQGDSTAVAGLLSRLLEQQFSDIALPAAVVGSKGWPTLEEMLEAGQRIVVFFEGDPDKERNNLFGKLASGGDPHPFILNLYDHFRYTYGEPNKQNSYAALWTSLEDICHQPSKVTEVGIHLDGFLRPPVHWIWAPSLQLLLAPSTNEDLEVQAAVLRQLQSLEHPDVQSSGGQRIEPGLKAALLHRDTTLAQHSELMSALLQQKAFLDNHELPPTLLANGNSTEDDSATWCACIECISAHLNPILTGQVPRHRSDSPERDSVLEVAYENCANNGKMINAIKVDYEEYGGLRAAVDRLNDLNVARFR